METSGSSIVNRPSSEKIIFFPTYPDFPVEIVRIIFSFLSPKEQAIVSRLNRSFRSLFDLSSLKIKAPFSEEIQRLYSYTFKRSGLAAKVVPVPKIIYLNEEVCFFSEAQYSGIRRIKPLSVSDFENEIVNLNKKWPWPLAHKVIGESFQYLILRRYDNDVIGIEKRSGNYVFNISVDAISHSQFLKNGIPGISSAHICSENPVTFVIFGGDAVSKWRFIEGKVLCTGQTRLKKSFDCANQIGNRLYLTHSEKRDRVEIISLETLEKEKISATDQKLFDILSRPNTARYGMQENLLLIAHENSKATLSFIDLKTAKEKWTQKWQFKAEYLASSVPGQRIVLKMENSKISILETQSGNLVKEIPLDRDLTCATLKPPFLFVACGAKIQVFHLFDGTLVETWSYPEESIIKDIYYDDLNLSFIVQKIEGHFTIESLQLKKTKAPDSELFEDIVMLPENSSHHGRARFEDIGNLPENTSHDEQSRLWHMIMIAEQVMGVFSLLLIGGFLIAYYKGPINLSIGLGGGAGLSGLVLIGLEVYRRKFVPRNS